MNFERQMFFYVPIIGNWYTATSAQRRRGFTILFAPAHNSIFRSLITITHSLSTQFLRALAIYYTIAMSLFDDEVSESCPARVGLMGNPSDGFNGKTLR
jgi:hypothetical protein